jgi:chitinase
MVVGPVPSPDAFFNSLLRDIRVALTEPSPGTVFPEGTNFTLCATAACPLTVISRVDFYDGGTWVGSADSGPYCIVRSNSPPGLRSLFAVATETEGLSATSAVVNVAVVPNSLLKQGSF